MTKGEIAKYLEMNDSVYCQNISGQMVSHTFTGAGKVMPFTWKKGIKPVCITDVIPKVLIIGDQAFEQLVVRNKLRLLEKAQYMEMIGQPVASESRPVIIPDAPEEAIELPPDVTIPVLTNDQTPDRVKKDIIDMVKDCNEGGTTVGIATDYMDAKELTADDLEYVIEHCQLKGVVKKATKLLKKVGKE